MTTSDHDLDDFEDRYPDDDEPPATARDGQDDDLVYSDVDAPLMTPLLMVVVVLVVASVLIAVAVGFTA